MTTSSAWVPEITIGEIAVDAPFLEGLLVKVLDSLPGTIGSDLFTTGTGVIIAQPDGVVAPVVLDLDRRQRRLELRREGMHPTLKTRKRSGGPVALRWLPRAVFAYSTTKRYQRSVIYDRARETVSQNSRNPFRRTGRSQCDRAHGSYRLPRTCKQACFI